MASEAAQLVNIPQLVRRLTKAQRAYLLALEPNHARIGIPAWEAATDREFRDRSYRKPMIGKSLATAWALVTKGVVAARPQPIECGSHYASLTPIGEQVLTALKETDNGR